MKNINIKSIIVSLALVVSISSCKKDLVQSKATFWPDIKVNGPELFFTYLNEPYTDSSAVVTVNGSPIEFTTENTVDITEAGAYTVSYSAINEDGISAAKVRTVIVVDTVGGLLSADLTGSFARVGQAGHVSNWVKDENAPFTYSVNNLGGVPPSNASYAVFNVPFVAYNVAPGIIVIPEQDLGAIGINYAEASLGGSRQIPFNTAAVSGDIAYAYVAVGPNFGTALRTFRKL